MSVIGIVGLAGSGKDTLCELLLKELPTYSRYAYADPLKQFAINVLNLTHMECYDPVLKETGVEFKVNTGDLLNKFSVWFSVIAPMYAAFDNREFYFSKFMQVLSNEYSVDSGFWNKLRYYAGLSHTVTFKTTPRVLLQLIGTEFFRNYIKDSFWVDIAPDKNIIVPDVRFPNEAEHIRNYGGIIIKIVDPNLKQISTTHHTSENFARSDIPGAVIIENDKTKGLDGLIPHVSSILNYLDNPYETNQN